MSKVMERDLSRPDTELDKLTPEEWALLEDAMTQDCLEQLAEMSKGQRPKAVEGEAAK